MRSVIQRLVAILMLSLLLLGMGTAMAAPEQALSTTVQLALDGDDGKDELTASETGVEASEVAVAPRAKLIQGSAFRLPSQADSPLPAAPFLEGPQRPPRAA